MEQVVAANIDTVFLCMALNRDFNIRRLERYLSIAWDSGAVPVIILTKVDLCDDLEAKRFEIEKVAVGVPVMETSGLTGDGLQQIKPYLQETKTVAFIGSSGVGKSTLIKILCGIYHADSGEIILNGKNVSIPTAQAAKDLGISTIYQELSIIPDLNAVQNIFLNRELAPGNSLFSKIKVFRMKEKARKVAGRRTESPDGSGYSFKICTSGSETNGRDRKNRVCKRSDRDHG